MAGSGGGGTWRDAGSDVGSPVDCAQLRFQTNIQVGPELADPNGDVLEVARTQASPNGPTIVAVVDDDGRILGSIVEDLARLTECLDRGVAFVALLQRNQDGLLTVMVRAADPAQAAGRYLLQAPIVGDSMGPIELIDTDLGTAARLAAAQTPLATEGTSELRALIRAGARASWHAIPETSDEISVSFPS